MGLFLLAAFGYGLVVFVGGFILGERDGRRDAERRWSDAVRKHADAVRREQIEASQAAATLG